MSIVRILALVLAAALLALIVWASLETPIGESFGRIVADPWGLVTLADLYLGFLLFSVVVVVFEPNRPLAVAVVLLTLVLGNLVTAVWLVARLPLLIAKKTGRT